MEWKFGWLTPPALYKNQAGNESLLIRFKGKCILLAIQKAM